MANSIILLIIGLTMGTATAQHKLQFNPVSANPGIAYSRVKSINISRVKWRLVTSIQFDDVNKIKQLTAEAAYIINSALQSIGNPDLRTESVNYLISEQVKDADSLGSLATRVIKTYESDTYNYDRKEFVNTDSYVHTNIGRVTTVLERMRQTNNEL